MTILPISEFNPTVYGLNMSFYVTYQFIQFDISDVPGGYFVPSFTHGQSSAGTHISPRNIQINIVGHPEKQESFKTHF